MKAMQTESQAAAPIPAALVKLLMETANLAADDALMAVLPGADVVRATQMVEILLSRRGGEGARQLITVFHTLGATQRGQILRSVERLEDALRSSMASRGERTRLNCIEVVQQSGAGRLAYIVCPGLSDESAAVREAAGGALIELSARQVARRPEAIGLPGAAPREESAPPEWREASRRWAEEMRALCQAVRQAAQRFRVHRRIEAVRAAMILAPDGAEELGELFKPGRGGVAFEALRALEQQPEARLAEFAHWALRQVPLRPGTARVISRCRAEAFMRAWFAAGPELEDAGLRWGLRSIHRLTWLEDDAGALRQLPVEVLPRAVGMIDRMGLPETVKYKLMRTIVFGEPNAAQAGALAAMLRLGEPELMRDLRTIASWGDEVLSAAAAEALRQRSSAKVRATEATAGVEAGPAERGPWAELDRYCEDFAVADEAALYERGEALKANRGALLAGVAARARSASVARRRQIIEIIRYLELESALEPVLAQLARDVDAIVRSGAVAALGGAAPSVVTRRILREALHDEDGRVRANAVEALTAQGWTEDLAPHEHLLRERDHRVRGTAVLGFLRAGNRLGGTELLRMLEDADRAHRISALWVVERMRLQSVSERIRRLAEADPDPVIRRRADHVVGALASTAGRMMSAQEEAVTW